MEAKPGAGPIIRLKAYRWMCPLGAFIKLNFGAIKLATPEEPTAVKAFCLKQRTAEIHGKIFTRKEFFIRIHEYRQPRYSIFLIRYIYCTSNGGKTFEPLNRPPMLPPQDNLKDYFVNDIEFFSGSKLRARICGIPLPRSAGQGAPCFYPARRRPPKPCLSSPLRA
jgi:hypothetical protein